MAKDHFKTHYYQKDRVDWNFNVLFANQPDVKRMRDEYAPLIKHPGLYDPIPYQWLHSTILRVGLIDDFTEAEMLKVADVLTPKLAELQLPEFVFDSWWLWNGNVVLHMSPSDVYSQIYDLVIESMLQVVGDKRTLKTPHGHFTPHVALAYTRTQYQEREINSQLIAYPVKPAIFTAPSLSLIRQWPTDGHYEWEIVQQIPIGQTQNPGHL